MHQLIVGGQVFVAVHALSITLQAHAHRRKRPSGTCRCLTASPATTAPVRTLRDPNNFNTQWRKVRNGLGVPGITTRSFRKSLATLIDDEGLSARVGADHVGPPTFRFFYRQYAFRRLKAPICTLSDRE
jgi:integrase